MLHVDPSSFSVIQFRENANDPLLAQLSSELPGLKKLVELLKSELQDMSQNLGRKYQFDIIDKGTFEIAALDSEATIRATKSAICDCKINNHGTAIFYGFDDPDLILGAFDLASGYPLSAIIIPSRKVFINLGDALWGLRMDHLDMLYELSEKDTPPGNNIPSDTVPTIVFGDSGYAHHIWNQLSPLEALISKAGMKDREITFLLMQQPLGPLTLMFPEAGRWSVEQCLPSEFTRFSKHNEIFVPLGGFIIPKVLRERVRRFALTQLSEAGAAIIDDIQTDGPVFWFSIRTRNRTPENQVETLVAISKALLKRYRAVHIILDGYSSPTDFETNSSYKKNQENAVIAREHAVADEIIGQLSATCKFGKRQKVVKAIGLPILDSIAIASLVDFYFCHHGTTQHKIGWFTNAPGIVHCNVKTLDLLPAQWVVDQVEDGTLPIYIDSELVDKISESRELSEVERSLRMENYKFKDANLVADFVLNAAERVIKQSSYEKLRAFFRRLSS